MVTELKDTNQVKQKITEQNLKSITGLGYIQSSPVFFSFPHMYSCPPPEEEKTHLRLPYVMQMKQLFAQIVSNKTKRKKQEC